VGGNRSAAHLSGVNVNGIIIAAYTLCSTLAGVAGLVFTGYNGFADNWVGRGFELNSIAAVVVGGTLFEGGRGGVVGTVAGVLIITILFNLVLLLGLDEEYQRIVKGVAIILAVAMYADRRRYGSGGGRSPPEPGRRCVPEESGSRVLKNLNPICKSRRISKEDEKHVQPNE
jgi:ribose transport system permease protein